MRRQLAVKEPTSEGEDVKEVQRKVGMKGSAVTAAVRHPRPQSVS